MDAKLSPLRKVLTLQVLIFTLGIGALTACGGSSAPKIDKRYPNNGGGNNPSKPVTSATGYNVAPVLALGLVPVKQVSRALDIAINKEKSTALHPCQKVTASNVDPNKTILTVSTSETCDTSAISWRAEEKFELTYDDPAREIKHLNSIKKSNVGIIQMFESLKGSERDVQLVELTFTLSRTAENTFTFEYSTILTAKTLTRSNSSRRPPVRTMNTSNIELSGQIKIGEKNERTVSLQAGSTPFIRLERSGGRNFPKETHTLALNADSAELPLLAKCAIPTGDLSLKQEHAKSGKPTIYPELKGQIDQNGTITVPDSGISFSTGACRTFFDDMSYMTQLADLLLSKVPGDKARGGAGPKNSTGDQGPDDTDASTFGKQPSNPNANGNGQNKSRRNSGPRGFSGADR